MRRSDSIADSFDLLLDTICNTFGALIFIALLVAILSQQSAPDIVTDSPSSTEMVERQIAVAEADLAALTQQIATAKAHSSPTIDLQRQLADLERIVADLESTLSDRSDVESAGSTLSATATDLASLKQSLASLQSKNAQAENALQAILENLQRLEKRISTLTAETGKLETSRTRMLRFPKEQARTKTPLYVIFKYNRAYFVDLVAPTNPALIISESGDSTTVTPIAGKGTAPAEMTKAVAALARNLSSGKFYFSGIVHADSVPAFNAFRDAAIANGFEYGWESGLQDSIIFSPEGAPPPAPL